MKCGRCNAEIVQAAGSTCRWCGHPIGEVAMQTIGASFARVSAIPGLKGVSGRSAGANGASGRAAGAGTGAATGVGGAGGGGSVASISTRRPAAAEAPEPRGLKVAPIGVALAPVVTNSGPVQVALGLGAVLFAIGILFATSLHMDLASLREKAGLPGAGPDALAVWEDAVREQKGSIALLLVVEAVFGPACVALFVLWVRDAHRNLDALGVDNLHFTPATAFKAFLYPPMNLVLPLHVVTELLRGSELRVTRGAGGAAPADRLAHAWWGATLGAIVLAALVALGYSSSEPGTIALAHKAQVACQVLGCAAIGLSYLVVAAVEDAIQRSGIEAQRETAAALEANANARPKPIDLPPAPAAAPASGAAEPPAEPSEQGA